MKEKVNISKVKSNPNNPRLIKDKKFYKLVNSIKEFPQMLEKRPIIVDEDMIILGGNMRLKACKEAGLKQVWIDIASGWTEKQKNEFIIKDNLNFGEWEWDMLANEWDMKELQDWGLDTLKFDLPEDTKDLSDSFKDSYRLEIEVQNEKEQEELYNKLSNQGYICRILTL
jgi:ParB-like chromosome segregation protein Spo0J